jgi:hypothetical protein
VVLLRKALIWLGRWGGLALLALSMIVSFTAPTWLYWIIIGPILIVVFFAMWYRERPRKIHLHPDMLPFDAATNLVVAEAINTGRTVEARVGPDGKVKIFRPMSIEAHPNLHAVRFLCMIAEPVLKDRRIPTDEELDQALRASLRGEATMDTPIDWPGLKESFQLLMAEAPKITELPGQKSDEFRKQTITSFVREISCRLDDAIRLKAE